MQIVTHAGLPQPSQPPSQSERSAPAGFAALLGSLFAAVPVNVEPAVARNSEAPGRATAARDVSDAVRPDDAGARQVTAKEEEAQQAATNRQNDRSAQVDRSSNSETLLSRPSDSAPADRSLPSPEYSGRANRDQGIASANAPADSASPSSTPEAPVVPVTPAAGSPAALTPTLIALPSQQAFEPVPDQGEKPAPSADAPAPAGNIAAVAPSFPSPTAPVATPVTTAGDAPVSAAAPSSTTADSQVRSVPASGPQAGSTTPVLRTAKPEGALAPSSVERVASAVKAQASLGGGRVKILLHPPHLGALRIEVVVRNSVVYARMETESQGARHSLQQHLSDLRQSLEDQGLALGQMSVSVSQGDGNGSEAPFASAPALLPFGAEPESVPDSRVEVRLPRLLDVTV